MLKFFWADINISAAYNQSTIVFPVWSRITSKSQPKSQIVNHTKMAWWTKSQSRFGRWDDDIITFNYNIQWNPICEYSYTTVPKRRMSHRKWRETKQQLTWLLDLALLGCCLVSLHFHDILRLATLQCIGPGTGVRRPGQDAGHHFDWLRDEYVCTNFLTPSEVAETVILKTQCCVNLRRRWSAAEWDRIWARGPPTRWRRAAPGCCTSSWGR